MFIYNTIYDDNNKVRSEKLTWLFNSEGLKGLIKKFKSSMINFNTWFIYVVLGLLQSVISLNIRIVQQSVYINVT